MKDIIFRKDKIVELCNNKKVLHLGFIHHSHSYEKKILEKDWLHEKINQVANQLVGIDYLDKEIKILREKYNYDVHFGDVMNLQKVNLDQKFEVIVCGELIEHLENPGLMLDGIKPLMDENAILIITTPNPWSQNRLKLIGSGEWEEKWLNDEHECWFSYETLKNILKRQGYIEKKYSYYYEESIEILESRYNKKLFGSLRLKFKKRNIYNSDKRKYTGLFFIVKLENY